MSESSVDRLGQHLNCTSPSRFAHDDSGRVHIQYLRFEGSTAADTAAPVRVPCPHNELRRSQESATELQIQWDARPRCVFIVKKRSDARVLELMREMCLWMTHEKQLRILVEPEVQSELSEYEAIDPRNPGHGVDFCICLGGDGTLLHLSHLFQDRAVPPCLSFGLGSLGFLTPFPVSDSKKHLEHILSGHTHPLPITLRMRLKCEIFRAGQRGCCLSFLALNEVLIDRGISPYLGRLDVCVDDLHVTTVQADGLIISTPTGSTAYSMSAGGPMVAPTVPCMILTPICPHTLSFRPIIIPDSSTLKIHVPHTARHSVFVSFDGRNQTELRRGDYAVVSPSKYPFPSFKTHPYNHEWFHSLVRKLHWNSGRELQKPLSAAM